MGVAIYLLFQRSFSADDFRNMQRGFSAQQSLMKTAKLCFPMSFGSPGKGREHVLDAHEFLRVPLSG
jgi:hypothetical protein